MHVTIENNVICNNRDTFSHVVFMWSLERICLRIYHLVSSVRESFPVLDLFIYFVTWSRRCNFTLFITDSLWFMEFLERSVPHYSSWNKIRHLFCRSKRLSSTEIISSFISNVKASNTIPHLIILDIPHYLL